MGLSYLHLRPDGARTGRSVRRLELRRRSRLLGQAGQSPLRVQIGSLDPDAKYESFKARDPLYGTTLEFEGTDDPTKGTNVGKEWDYRTYISGQMAPGQADQFAVWNFADVPAYLAKRDKVRCEF